MRPLSNPSVPELNPPQEAVTDTLKSLHVDDATLQAAILVDAGADNDHRESTNLITAWVERVQQIEQLTCPQEILDNPPQLEMWRRLILALANDIHPLLIVLARQLETLRISLRDTGQEAIGLARESLGIHAPLASRLGVHRLKWELEDLSFRCLEPTTYRHLASQLTDTRRARESYVAAFIERLQSTLTEACIQARVQGRPKHLYSIWRKMQRKRVDLHGLFDLNAVRVLVDDIPACYQVLALVHDLWEPIPEEYDDYIARPKGNGYQSLHTVVHGPQGLPVEIQIRTEAMHTLAEYGMAAHWRYKEGSSCDPALERTVQALRRSLEAVAANHDWFAGQIFVLTPRHQVIRLPQGATPVDFAYAIHTVVGHRCRGARVDGRIVPLNYPLQTGQQVEILTSNHGVPNRDWLGQVRSDHARQRIRQWFRQKEAEGHHRLGRQRLEKEAQRLGLNEIGWPLLLRHFRLHQPEEVWLAIGRGQITPGQLVTALRTITSPPSHSAGHAKPPPATDPSQPDTTLRVHGERNLLTHLAKCCHPTPGDEVIGYLTIHHRITVHKNDCPNIRNLPEKRRARLVEAVWE